MFREKSIFINSVIADYSVNENFGDNMISLKHDDVKEPFGPLVVRKLPLMVDERTSRRGIMDRCCTWGMIDVDVTNRRRAGSVVTGCEVEGAFVILHAKPGRYLVSVATASGDIGGQAPEAVDLYGEHP